MGFFLQHQRQRGWKKGAYLSGATGLAVLSFAVNAAAVTPAPCSQPYDVYQASAATKSACGVKDFPRQSAVTNADGSRAYSYDVDGLRTTFHIPPASFDPRTASPAEITQLGLPPQPPIGSAAYQRWVSMLSNKRWVTPPPVLSSIPVTANATSNNWSGIEDTGGSYADVYGAWNRPYDHGTPCGGNGALFWAGLGGDGVARLAQDGEGINTRGLGQHQTWYQVLPTQHGGLVPINLYDNGGGLFAEVYLNSGGGGAAQFGFYMGSGNQSVSFTVGPINGYSGRTAEVIAERPSYNGYLPPLTNFGTFQVDGSALYGYPNHGIDMYNGWDLLATPSSLFGSGGGSGSFNDYHENCQ